MKKVNCENIQAQSLSKTQLKENTGKTAVEENISSDVKTGHGTPNIGHEKEKIGPVEI